MNGTHLHLIVTHIPVLGILGAIGILGVGLWRGWELLQKTGLVLLVITGLGAGAAYLTGEGAEEGIEQRAGVPESLVERHEEVAQVAMIGAVVIALAAAGVLVSFRRRSVHRGLVAAVLVLALADAGALAYTANLGGQVGHPEIRAAQARNGGEGGAAAEDD